MVIKHIPLSHQDFVLLLFIRSFSVEAQCASAMLAGTGARTNSRDLQACCTLNEDTIEFFFWVAQTLAMLV